MWDRLKGPTLSHVPNDAHGISLSHFFLFRRDLVYVSHELGCQLIQRRVLDDHGGRWRRFWRKGHRLEERFDPRKEGCWWKSTLERFDRW